VSNEERRYGRLELCWDVAWWTVLVLALLWLASGTQCEVKINMLDSEKSQEPSP
jgi:hypothetical protein